jgi:hypothetical protein
MAMYLAKRAGGQRVEMYQIGPSARPAA